MNDYRILNSEQIGIRNDYKRREIVQVTPIGMEIKKSLFWEYPKFLRCHESLFPNNYLDVVELKNKQKLSEIFNEFKLLITSSNIKEREILNFINSSHDNDFLVGSIMKAFFRFGHHESNIFSEFPLGTSYKVDHLLLGRNSHGWHFIFVEFEAIEGQITTKNGDFGAVLRKGESQIKDWEIWLEKNFNILTEFFLKKIKPNDTLPTEFYNFDRTRIHYVVVAGRRSDFNERTYRLAREHLSKNIHYIHYDNLIDICNELIISNYLTY